MTTLSMMKMIMTTKMTEIHRRFVLAGNVAVLDVVNSWF